MTTSLRPRVLGAALTAAALLGGITACGSSSTASPHPSSSPTLGPAAEPSHAPVPTTKPAGTVIELPHGSMPEGVAVDHRTGQVGVAMGFPDRLAIVDESSLHVRIESVPGKARHLVLDGDHDELLLPAEDRNTLVEIALPSGHVIRSIPLLKQPHNAEPIGDDIWVADELASAVSVLDPHNHVVATLHGPVQPGGIAAAAGTAGVVDVRGARMYFYDTTTFQPEGSIPLGSGPTHALPIGGPYVLANDTRGGALLLVDMATRRIVDRVATGGGPYGIATDPSTGRAWVTLTKTNRLLEVRRDGARISVTGSLPTVQQPNTVGEDPVTGCLYVAGVVQAQLQVVCPAHPDAAP